MAKLTKSVLTHSTKGSKEDKEKSKKEKNEKHEGKNKKEENEKEERERRNCSYNSDTFHCCFTTLLLISLRSCSVMVDLIR